MDVLNFKEILVRKPFWEIKPRTELAPRLVYTKQNISEPTAHNQYRIVTQEEFLRMYYPSGHKINDPLIYPDIYKQDPDTKKWHIQPITRCAFAMQQIFVTKQTVHLTGNDVQFELAEISDDEEVEDRNNKLLLQFKKGWLSKGMEMHFFDAVYSIKAVADAAIVGYFNNGKFGCKTFSFLRGDKMYPHHNPITGELELFARQYYDYDDEGNAVIEWVEVWDEKYIYRAKKDVRGGSSVVAKIKGMFGLGGYKIVSQEPHGFNFIPVAYYREEEGPCYLPAQDTIEKYEEAQSYFFENNKAYAFPIMVLKGEGVELQGDMNGSVKAITIDDTNGSADFMQHNDVSASYNTLLSTLYQLMYEQSFTVKPPELKSGDLPGVALKLLYSPAIEKAIVDCQKLQPFLDTLVKMVKYGYGLEAEIQADLLNLNINAWIEPYVHQNDTEITTNLATAVQNNFLSKQTASERYTKYSKNDEIARIAREAVEKMHLAVEQQTLITEFNTDETIREEKTLSASQEGSDINTGHGHGSGRQGRPNVWNTDEWGNREGENNWQRQKGM